MCDESYREIKEAGRQTDVADLRECFNAFTQQEQVHAYSSHVNHLFLCILIIWTLLMLIHHLDSSQICSFILIEHLYSASLINYSMVIPTPAWLKRAEIYVSSQFSFMFAIFMHIHHCIFHAYSVLKLTECTLSAAWFLCIFINASFDFSFNIHVALIENTCCCLYIIHYSTSFFIHCVTTACHNLLHEIGSSVSIFNGWFFIDGQLGAEDTWLCPNCHKCQRGTIKSLNLSTLPDLMIIHLKRFKQAWQAFSQLLNFQLMTFILRLSSYFIDSRNLILLNPMTSVASLSWYHRHELMIV